MDRPWQRGFGCLRDNRDSQGSAVATRTMNNAEDKPADLVVGCGIAGPSTAVTALRSGLSVTILERANRGGPYLMDRIVHAHEKRIGSQRGHRTAICRKRRLQHRSEHHCSHGRTISRSRSGIVMLANTFGKFVAQCRFEAAQSPASYQTPCPATRAPAAAGRAEDECRLGHRLHARHPL